MTVDFMHVYILGLAQSSSSKIFVQIFRAECLFFCSTGVEHKMGLAASSAVISLFLVSFQEENCNNIFTKTRLLVYQGETLNVSIAILCQLKSYLVKKLTK